MKQIEHDGEPVITDPDITEYRSGKSLEDTAPMQLVLVYRAEWRVNETIVVDGTEIIAPGSDVGGIMQGFVDEHNGGAIENERITWSGVIRTRPLGEREEQEFPPNKQRTVVMNPGYTGVRLDGPMSVLDSMVYRLKAQIAQSKQRAPQTR